MFKKLLPIFAVVVLCYNAQAQSTFGPTRSAQFTSTGNGTSSGSGSGFPLTTNVDGSLVTNVPGTWIDVTKSPYNAAGNGVTDDTAAFTNALIASAATGLPVLVPNRTYKMSPFTIYTNQCLHGENGARLLFSSSSSGVAVTMDFNSTNVSIVNLEIVGGKPESIPGSDDGRVGVLFWNCQQPSWTLQNVYVHGFGIGIEVYGINQNQDSLGRINNCEVRYCWTGLYILGQAEYMTYTGIKCVENHYGLAEYGGNNTFTSCNFSRNVINAVFGDQGNGSHCSFSSCTFNHGTSYALMATNTLLGMSFDGCTFLPPNMYMTNVQGFTFVNCLMGWNSNGNTISFINSTNCAILFPQNPYAITNSYTVVTSGSTNIVYQLASDLINKVQNPFTNNADASGFSLTNANNLQANTLTLSNSSVAGKLTLASASGTTNIILDGSTATLTLGATTNVASFTLVQTNWIDGRTYTNQTGRPIFVMTPCSITPTTVSGAASYSLRVPGATTNSFAVTTVVGTLAMSMTNQVSAFVTNSGTFTFTNTSSGAGDSGAILVGGQYMVY